MSEIAETMRQEVIVMVGKGFSKDTVLQHYKDIYGEQILMVPDGRMGQVVSAIPVTAFTLGSGVLALVLWKMHQRKNLLAPQAVPQIISDDALALRERIRRESGW